MEPTNGKFDDCAKEVFANLRAEINIHLVTKMSDMTRRFEVILTSFSSDECNGQFKFKIKFKINIAMN